MTNHEATYSFGRVARFVAGAAIVLALFALLRYLSDVLLPFAAAVVLAYLLNPLVKAVEQRTKRRGAAVALTLVGLAVVGLALVAIVVPLMIGQVRDFGDALEKLRADLAVSVHVSEEGDATSPGADAEPGAAEAEQEKSALGWRELEEAWKKYRRDAEARPRSQRLADLMEAVSGTYVGDLLNEAQAFTGTQEFKRLLIETAKQVAIGGWTVATFAVNFVLGLTGLIIVLLYLVFLLLDFPAYASAWPASLPPDYRRPIVEFWEQFEFVLRRYFRGQAVVAIIVGVLFAIGFSIIGLPMAVPFGLFVGLLNMIPYLQIVGLVPGVVLAGLRAIEGDSSFLFSIVLVLLVFGVVQLIQDSLITPRIMGKATGLSPVAILLGVFIWGKLLGFLGLLLAIPLTCLFIAYYRRYVLKQVPETTRLAPGS